MKHVFKIADALQVTVEFDGPYSAELWAIRRKPDGAFIGNGIDMRAASESAVRALRSGNSQYGVLYDAVERELQDWLLTHPMADIRQGDSHCRLYCLLTIIPL